jgi:replication factor C large subunit
MIGNEDSRMRLVRWLDKWKPGAKAALLVGPPGTGKTTMVHLLAEVSGLNLVELNASDTRTKERLSKKIGEVLGSTSLLGERSLVFLDEVDGLAGRSDYGAVEFIKDSVKRSENPVVMAANNADSDQVGKLASVSLLIQIRPPPPREVHLYLKTIARKEKLQASDDELSNIVRAAGGDIRFAVNALQSGTKGLKDVEMTAAQSINAFFDASDAASALKALRAYPDQPRDRLRDLFGSVVKARLAESDRARALEVISRGDVLLGRIAKGKDWRLLRYFDTMLAYGLKESLGEERLRYSRDILPWSLQLRVWNDSKKIREIARIAGPRLGTSQRGMLIEDFPYMMVLCNSPKFREELARSLNLDESFGAFMEKEAGRYKA